MSSMIPMQVYGLEVPPGDDVLVEAAPDFPATFRITMAALDPSAIPLLDFHPDGAAPRATLKLIRERIDPLGDDDSDDDDYDDDIDAIRARLGITEEDDEDEDEDSEESDSDDEKNGGPSDPSRSKKAIVEKLKKALKGKEDMDLDDVPNGLANGIKSEKGKGKASDVVSLGDDSDEESEDDEIEEFVLCTLDPEKHYQQPLDITVNENEKVYFKVSGTHTIFLTGNYVIEPDVHNHDHEEDSSDEEMEYDLSPDEDELDDEDEEDDVLDSIKDPRITEVDSEEEEAPKLVKAAKSKGKNKRPADDSDEEQAVTLDDMISKSMKSEPATNGEQHLSKKQLKKLKKNDGQATATAKDQKDTPNSAKSDKKVQFAKNLEQGPTGSPLAANGKNGVKKDESLKTGLGPKIVQGVTIDDKKLGKGPAAKKGDRIGMRYIGKLAKDGKVFDSNKKGKPFTFKLGVGEVIKGWDIGVAGMTVGGERRITIPAKLAYGNKALPGIPANSELVFDIKMMSVN
ncbi:uncharacterized protein BDZ99DRAFT_391959 [Mytilinidion resinicola]|uniref:peptidylprolyl isomerase n=1 Tax=Mytilinidion resinicola TaxID=574789 RepID=A0A6A6YH78_9PEZI|nr:uncharacterized protein BDZ99DRAFT_391959 [Mytilinidion resinicola]KAF2807938.1 hypothetical protein BDZ99DRAFT_391959 [Mytilinidion resinicola]